MSDVRDCEQCGTRFTPRREHARFCSARCRVAWNRADRAHHATDDSALSWAITAMTDTTDRLPKVAGLDRPRAFAVISEAVWWVTIVDANLVRYHPDAYDSELGSRTRADRLLIEETLAGLRFVRNQIGHDLDHANFIRPGGQVADASRGRGWAWTSLPEPTGSSLSPRSLEWELGRYRAYQAQLAGRPVETTFRCAASFLNVAAAGITVPADVRALD